MTSRLIKIVVVVLCFVSFAQAGIELTRNPYYVNLRGDEPQYNTCTFGINIFDEIEDFSIYMDILQTGSDFRVELSDGRTDQVVYSMFFLDIFFPVYYTIDIPSLGPASGDLGFSIGPYSVGGGKRIEFTRLQSIGIAPNGVVGTVDVTFIPEPATILLLSLGCFLIYRKS